MGLGASSVSDLIDQIDAGDSSAVPQLWDQVSGDTAVLVSAVTTDIKSSLDEMEDIDKMRKFAKIMVKSHVLQTLDPNSDNTISKDEFTKIIVALLQEDD